MNNAPLIPLFPLKTLPIVLPILRPDTGCEPRVPSEISAALHRCFSSYALSPDTIPYSVCNRAPLTALQLLTHLLGPLRKFSYHPVSMKKGNSIVLDKPCKPYWDLPASFRASLLRQTFSTIRERVIASRLSLVAMSLYLVHYKQCGCLPALSSFDPALLLVNTVRTLQFPSLKVSTLFLNMKGSFDNVNVSILCSSLKKAAVPNYAVAWIGSFPSQRTSCLLFQGSLNTFSAVQVGPQQGSPISPPMFVISVASLHIDPAQRLSLSYIDHFALSAASASYRGNVSTLQ